MRRPAHELSPGGLIDRVEREGMPLKDAYEPSTMQRVRDQVELHESSGGTQGTALAEMVDQDDQKRRDLPVVVLTTVGAKSGRSASRR